MNLWMNVTKVNKFVFFIVLKRLFNEGNKKHFSRVLELEIGWFRYGISPAFLPNFHACFYNYRNMENVF